MTSLNGNSPKRAGWYRRFLGIFSGGSHEQTHPEGAPQATKDPLTLEEEGEIHAGMPNSDASGDGYHEADEAGFASGVWRLGVDDSSLGQNASMALHVLRSKSELDWLERQLRASRGIEERNSKLALLKKREEQLAANAETLRERRWQLSAHPLLPPSNTPQLMPYLYILIGVLAFVAEFPLAAALIDRGFQIYSAELESLTDQSLTALAGIFCLFGIAGKIFLDGRVHKPVVPEGAPGEKRIRGVRRFILIAELLVLLACLMTVGSLAYLRVVSDNLERIEEIADIQSFGGVPAPVSDELRIARAARERAAGYALWLLTFTLPMFAAMSLSTGATRLVQRDQDKEAYKVLKTVEAALESCRQEIGIVDAEVKSAVQRYNDETKSVAIKEALLKTREAVYEHGYGRGKVHPDRPRASSHYEMHRESLRRIVKRQIRASYAMEHGGKSRS